MVTSNKSRGFTIVELLIVIVVIGILAAIVIVSFRGIQERAVTTSITSDYKNINQKLEIYKIDIGKYPSEPDEELNSRGIKVNQSNYAVRPAVDINFVYCWSESTQQYAIVSISSTGKKFATGSNFPTREILPASTAGTGINTSNYADLSCSYFASDSIRKYAGYDPSDRHPYPGDTIPWRKWVSSTSGT